MNPANSPSEGHWKRQMKEITLSPTKRIPPQTLNDMRKVTCVDVLMYSGSARTL